MAKILRSFCKYRQKKNSRNVSHFRLINKPILNLLGQIFQNFQNFLEVVEAVRCRRNDGWSIEVELLQEHGILSQIKL